MDSDGGNAGPRVFTIGHSSHSLDTFLDLLRRQQITCVVDVRSSPHSAYAPHFNKSGVERSLIAQGIRYVFLGDKMGGKPEGQAFYDDEGHVLYYRLAQSERFQQGINDVMREVQAYRVALLCGEEDPTECHRRVLIGRVLGERGLNVFHLRGDGGVQREEEVAKDEDLSKTKGQGRLFDMEEAEEWKSAQSVLPRKEQRNSSVFSGEPGSNV